MRLWIDSPATMSNLEMMRYVSQIFLCVTLLSFGCLAGCHVAGYAASVFGSPAVEAEYVPKQTPLMVIVRDPPDLMGVKIESDSIRKLLENQIIAHKIAPLLPYEKLEEMRDASPAKFMSMSIAQQAKAAGAQQLLMVDITNSSLDSGTTADMIKGQIAVDVSVIDTESNKIAWPKDGSSGMIVTYATPMLRVAGNNNELNVSRNLHAGIAEKIGRLFRKYKPED